MSEKIPHDENDDIPIILIEPVNVQLELNKSPKTLEFIDVKYAQLDELYATKDDPPLSLLILEMVGVH